MMPISKMCVVLGFQAAAGLHGRIVPRMQFRAPSVHACGKGCSRGGCHPMGVWSARVGGVGAAGARGVARAGSGKGERARSRGTGREAGGTGKRPHPNHASKLRATFFRPAANWRKLA